MNNANSRVDTSSFSNYQAVVSQSVHLDWTLDFEHELISGKAVHSMKVIVGGTTTADFDTSNLHITSASIDGTPVKFAYAGAQNHLGRKLSVEIPQALRAEGRIFEVQFEYSTDVTASAVQWIAASGTKGGVRPFVFTQCQAIHARSLLPCQDSPGIKTPYSADVWAPTWCTVLMSALQVNHTSADRDGMRLFKWKQPVPTPAYLIALAAGRLEGRELSHRVKVWAEPEVVEAAAFEFSETEDFLSAAESITCPYVWTRYDVLCLPPSFPYGGMENPCLTFATPTLLAGDKSLADVIAHEIAHSWTGNFVTNATWEHFWLNEGWTVWLERKIIAKVRGGEEHLKLSAEIGWKALVDSVAHMGEDAPFTALVWPLKGEDPDDAFSTMPYEKGFNLLYYLEKTVGTKLFESFAKAYISKFQFSTVTSQDFKNYFMTYFSDNNAVKNLDWDNLFYARGMPKHTPDFSNSLSAHSKALANTWIEAATTGNNQPLLSAGPQQMEGWSSQQRCIFLELLLLHSSRVAPFSASYIEKMDLAYGFTASNNSEVKFRWQTLCLQSEVNWIVPHVVQFLVSQGRMKFVRPLYRALKNAKVGDNGRIARETFIANAGKYHPIARKMVAQDLGVTLSGGADSTKDEPAAPASAPAATSSIGGWIVENGLSIAIGIAAVGLAFALRRK